MADTMHIAFLCQRLKELRTTNGLTMEEMAEKMHIANKSSLSRVESGKTSEKTLVEMAKEYCKVFGMSETQTDQFLRGKRIAVPDTSALLRNVQLIDELNDEYSVVVIPKVVVDELTGLKGRSNYLGTRAWEVISGISYGERTVLREYHGDNPSENNDCKIIAIARAASDEFHCSVDIITDDKDYSAYLKSDEAVRALHIREYMATKQSSINMIKLSRIDEYYADSYDDIEPPTREEANAYLPNGNTLIISAIRNTRPTITFQQRKEKILWLIRHGADVNMRDCGRRYFPPLSHAIQADAYDLFLFLLDECHADPNIGSRNPYDAGQVRQKNEGNMPLMIAAWHGKIEFVKALLHDERTSINQQDANGYTALIKASRKGYDICIGLLKEAGADQKIVDIDGRTADDWHDIYHKQQHQRSRQYEGENRRPYVKGNRK